MFRLAQPASVSAFFAALSLYAVVGCGSAPNTQFLPVGTRCNNNSTCGTTPYNCNTSLPGGYCQRDCSSNAECPTDSVCGKGQCRRKCTDSGNCRMTDGYVCRDVGAVDSMFGCDVP